MVLTCSKCSRANPAEAVYCYFDGFILGGAGRGPLSVGAQPFAGPFVFSSGRVCRSFDELAIACQEEWPAAADMLKRIGEPYVSRRPSADEGDRGGLGLGVFIARTLLERTGAKVSFSNRTFPDHGAVVQIVWPRSRFETKELADEPAG